MPFKWVEPELLLEHRGVRIWCTYKDDDIENPSSCWFATADWVSQGGDHSENYMFDVRDLPVLYGMDRDATDLRIRFAIDERRLILPEENGYTYQGSWCADAKDYLNATVSAANMKAELAKLCNLRSRAESNGSGNAYRVAWCADVKDYTLQVLTVNVNQRGWFCLHEAGGTNSDPEDYFERTGKSYTSADRV